MEYVSKKIIEDHREKDGSASSIDRKDMRILVSLVQFVLKKYLPGFRVGGVALAGAVAVDMLAISALLKNYVLPVELGEKIIPPVSQLTGSLLIDIPLFSLIIFATVSVAVCVAQQFGKNIRAADVSIPGLPIFLRLLEPFLVFFIAFEGLRSFLALNYPTAMETFVGARWPFDAVCSILVVASLLVASGLKPSQIFDVMSASGYKIEENPHPSEPFVGRVELVGFLRLLGFIVVFLSIILGSLWYSFSTVKVPHSHYAEATLIVSIIVLAVSVLILYVPWNALDRFETSTKFDFSDDCHSLYQEFSTFSGALIAASVFLWYAYMLLGGHFLYQAALIWVIYFMSSWFMFRLRKRRFKLAIKVGARQGTQNDSDFSEMVAAVGFVSSAVALLTGRIVAVLFTQ